MNPGDDMRVNAGNRKGAKLLVPAGASIRPTSDRAKQAIFNILSHYPGAIIGARVLDAFAGSGALGIEALSRGAASLVAFDTSEAALSAIRRNIEHCRLGDCAVVLRADAAHPPLARDFPSATPCSLVFLDPPYHEGLVEAALAALGRAGWLAAKALIVAEMGLKDTFDVPAGFDVLDERQHGAAKLIILAAPSRV